MIFLILFFILAGLGTFVSSWMAMLIYKLRVKSASPVKSQNISLDVLIPAHNEKESLPATIQAIRATHSSTVSGISQVRVLVGLSNWSGEEAKTAACTADEILEIAEPGKWWAIQQLVKRSQADWIALVDSGTIWPADILQKISQDLNRADVVALNPRYQEISGGVIAKIIWKMESLIKKVENKAGGPISLHGATIFYRREKFVEVLDYLHRTAGQSVWLNDDVVGPLTTRLLFPELRILYRSDIVVSDHFSAPQGSEVRRRERLLIGNLQWMHLFLGLLVKKDQTLFFLALRRVCRMMWAWWFICLFLGVFLFWPGIVLPAVVAGIGVMFSSKGRRILDALRVSILFPYYVITFHQRGGQARWR